MIKYTKELLSEVVRNNFSVREVIAEFGIKYTTSSYRYIKNKINKYSIDTSHFRSQTYSGNIVKRIPVILAKNSTSYRVKAELLRKEMVKVGITYKCSKCGNNGKWLDEELTLQVDHKDDDCFNNEPDNLQFLCPNCHWLKTKKSYKKKDCKLESTRDLCSCGKAKCINSKVCKACRNKNSSSKRKVTRPEKDILKSLILHKSFKQIGIDFGVSDNAVRKWCLTYGIDIKSGKFSHKNNFASVSPLSSKQSKV